MSFSSPIPQFYVQSGTNNGRYVNDRVAELFTIYRQTADQVERDALLEEMQRTFGEDVPVVYVLSPNQIHGFSKRVQGYVPHPLENYKYGPEITVDA